MTYYQKNARAIFNNLDECKWTNNTDDMIYNIKNIDKDDMTAYEYFIQGAAEINTDRGLMAASRFYKAALDDIKRGNVFDHDREEIIAKISNHAEGMDVRVRKALEPIRNDIKIVERGIIEQRYKAIETKVDSKLKPDKSIVVEKAKEVDSMRSVIKSDMQNVHTRAATSEFARSYVKLQCYNYVDRMKLKDYWLTPPRQRPQRTNEQIFDDSIESDDLIGKDYPLLEDKLRLKDDKWIEDISFRDDFDEVCAAIGRDGYTEFKDWADQKEMILSTKDQDTSRLKMYLNILQGDKSVINVLNKKIIKEQDVIGHVFYRITSNANRNNYDLLDDALYTAIESCVPAKGSQLCETGRTENIIGSLATLDGADITLGGFVSEGELKNEMISKSAKFINDAVMKLSEKARKIYVEDTGERKWLELPDDNAEKNEIENMLVEIKKQLSLLDIYETRMTPVVYKATMQSIESLL
jgi:hypothetical protein